MTDLLIKTNQFKTGDIVIPRRFAEKDHPEVGWSPQMEDLLGEKCIIIRDREYCDFSDIKTISMIDNDGLLIGAHWCWPIDRLTLIKSKENE